VSVLASLVLASTLGCQNASMPFRASPFPPDLKYLPPAQIQTSMWVLAAEVQHLEALLEDAAEAEDPAHRAEVRNTLERMRVAARALDMPGRTTQHPVLNENLGLFIERIDRAKLALDRDPPSYFQASTIAGSCFLCHGQTRGTAALSTIPRTARGPRFSRRPSRS
jgi:cytochrome c553